MPVSLVSRSTERNSTLASAQAYRPDIDGLRALAVLLVVFFHAGFVEISGGFIGVDIFFVISGYLITGIIARELDAGHFTISDFYVRRIKRICPALFTLLGLSAIAGLFLLIPTDLRDFGRSITSTVLFYSNWNFYAQVGYFDGPAIEKPLLHTWSLAIEEQFYLLWPLCLALFYRFGGRGGLRFFILALFGISLAASQLELADDPARSFYLLPYRAWELLLGAFLAAGPLTAPPRAAASAIGALAFAAILYAALAFNARTPFPGFNGLFPCLGAAALIYAGLQPQALSHRILSLEPIRFAGKISYSLYLVHWPLFSFTHIYLDQTPNLGQRLAIVALCFPLATLSYWYIEMPVRQAKFRFQRVMLAAVPAAVVLVVCGILFHATNGLPGRAPEGVQTAIAAHAGVEQASCLNGPRPQVARACPIGVPATGMQYDFAVWGDSHARVLASALTEGARARNLSGVVLSQSSCPPFLGGEAMAPACKNRNAGIAEWLKTQQKLKLVLLAGFWSKYVGKGLLGVSQDGGGAGGTSGGLQGASGGFGETLSFLRSLNFDVAIFEDVPSYPVDVTYCAARARMFGRSDERCLVFPRQNVEEDLAGARTVLHAVRRQYGVRLIETVFAFCEGDTCRTEKNGVILYGDSNHLSISGARYLGERLDIPWPAVAAARADIAGLKGAGQER